MMDTQDGSDILSQNGRFIQEQLISKGYTMEQVSSYLKEQKEDGDNLDNWIIDELMSISAEFEQAHPLQENKYDYPQQEDQPENVEEQKEQNVPSLAAAYHRDPEEHKKPIEIRQPTEHAKQQEQVVVKKLPLIPQSFIEQSTLQTPMNQVIQEAPRPQQDKFIESHYLDPQQSQLQNQQQSNFQNQQQQNFQNQQQSNFQNQQSNVPPHHYQQGHQPHQAQQPYRSRESIRVIQSSLNEQVLKSQVQFEPLDKGAYVKVIPCRMLAVNPASPIQSPDLMVQIKQYCGHTNWFVNRQGGGLFSKNYIVYLIELKPSNIIVPRRYTDFSNLKDYLAKNYPEFLVPPIPKKNGKNKQSNLIEFRMNFLEIFCKRLLSIDEFRADPLVEAFFTAQDEKDLKNAYAKYAKIPRITDAKNIQTLNGQMSMQMSQQHDTYYTQKNALYDQLDVQYKKIRKLSRKIIQDNFNIQTNMREMANCFTVVQGYYSTFNFASPIGKNLIAESINVALNNMFLLWSAKLEDQSKLIQNHITHYYKFQKKEFLQVKELLKFRDGQQQELQKAQNRLEIRKDKLFKEQNIQKMELTKETLTMYPNKDVILANQALAHAVMLPKESITMGYMHDNFAYYNQKIYEQLRQQEVSQVKDTAMNFIVFCQKQLQLEDSKLYWEDIIKSFKNLGQGINKLQLADVQSKIMQMMDDD